MARDTRNLPTLVVGASLIVLGALILLAQWTSIDLWGYLWPLFVIVPGVLFFVGMILGGRSTGGLAIPGSIITIAGLLLLFSNTTNQWPIWAYAWSLIAPTGVGLGLIIFGAWSQQEHLVRDGKLVGRIGLIIFAVGFAFFELILGISGFPIAATRIALPVVLIVAGAYLLVRYGLRPGGGGQSAPGPND